MPLSADTIELAVSIATGVIKLVRRVDDLAAENAASQRSLALANYFHDATYNAPDLRQELQAFADTTVGLPQDLRDAIDSALQPGASAQALCLPILEDHAPERLAKCVVGTNVSDQLDLLHTQFQQDRADIDLQRAIHFVGPGANGRARKLPWRIAMVLLDVTAEFLIVEQERVFKHQNQRRVVVAVLTKFAEGDLEDTAGTPSLLFRRVLSATLNGFLDSRVAWDGDNPWLDAVLTALSDARDGSPDRDDFLLGLVQGTGYRRLIKELAEEGAKALRDNDREDFKDILADLIENTGTLYGNADMPGKAFLREHWADIARAGLKSFAVRGPKILDSDNVLLKQSLVAAASALANGQGRDLLTPDTVVAATEAVIAAVAAGIVDPTADPDWPDVLVSSFAEVVTNNGLRATFTGDGLESIVRTTLLRVADHPDMLAGDSAFGQVVVGSILGKIAETEVLDADALGSAAIEGALLAIADRPDLVAGASYAEALGDFAKGIAELVADRGISTIQGKQILGVAAASMAANPGLLSNVEQKLASKVVSMVVDVAGSDPPRILAGAALTQLISSVLESLSRHGGARLGDGEPVDALVGRLRGVISNTLAHASGQIGRLVNIPSAAATVDLVVQAWSRGEISEDIFNRDEFEAFFAEIANTVGPVHTIAVVGR